MDEATRTRTVASARALERAGDHDGAWRAYLKAGAVDDAARILSGLGRPREAAELVMREFAIDVRSAGTLDEPRRRHARKAAVLLSQAEDWLRAGELYGALGDLERAAQCFERGGDEHTAERLRQRLHGHARSTSPRSLGALEATTTSAAAAPSRTTSLASIPVAAPLEVQTTEGRAQAAYRRGDFATAGRAFLDAGLAWESAVAFSKGNDELRCFDSLQSVDLRHPRYRSACRHAINLAHHLDRLPERLLAFVSTFVSSLPESDEELAAMLVFAELEMRFGHRAHALSRIEALEARYSDKTAVRQVAARLRAQAGAPLAGSAGAENTVTMPSAARPDAALRAASLIPAGTVLAGRFRIEKRVGRGGYASVYRAHDLELDAPLALKVLDGNENEQGQANLKREVALARRLAHPNIVNVWDFVVHEGLFLIKMELLEGRMLRDRMSEPVSVEEAVEIVAQACEGLQFAHDHGVVHRDVKPDNLFVTSEGIVKLMDFGVARSFNDGQRARPSQPVIVPNESRPKPSAQGSPHYMAPEHSSTFEHLAPAADQYALGVVAFELLTGRLPFDAATVPELLGLHALAPIPTFQLADEPRSERLQAAVHRMMAKTVDGRFPTCRTAAEALRAALR